MTGYVPDPGAGPPPSLPVYWLGGLSGINLNDHVNYFVDAAGVDLGEMQTTSTEEINYAGGANVQTQVLRGSLVAVTIPMWVQGSSLSNLKTLLVALWAQVDKPPGNTFVTDLDTYTLAWCSRPSSIPRDVNYILNFRADFTLVLTRQP